MIYWPGLEALISTLNKENLIHECDEHQIGTLQNLEEEKEGRGQREMGWRSSVYSISLFKYPQCPKCL